MKVHILAGESRNGKTFLTSCGRAVKNTKYWGLAKDLFVDDYSTVTCEKCKEVDAGKILVDAGAKIE